VELGKDIKVGDRVIWNGEIYIVKDFLGGLISVSNEGLVFLLFPEEVLITSPILEVLLCR
jgi:hypothetical protein